MERAVLDHVPGAPGAVTSTGIAVNIFGPEPAEPQLRSMRRAIASLARKGLIITWTEPAPSAIRGTVAGAYRAPDHSWHRWERDPGLRYGDRLKTVCQRPA
jgi:hypothetical protein